MQVKCTISQAQALLAARSYSRSSQKAEKRRVFAQIRQDYPSLSRRKFVLFIEDEGNPLYCVLRDKHTKLPLDDGRPEPLQLAAPVRPTVAPAPVTKKAGSFKVAAPVKKAPVKKVAAKKAPAVKPKAPAKAPAKTVKAKAPAAKKTAKK